MASKVALALVFASIVGWALAAAWVFLLMRKIAIEEAYLQSVFGSTYEAYSQKTARILPGIY
jgi:protein-S-isoprenylcysteine O-methyltransferase Ste14